MSDLQQISLCLKQATSQSLILIDEFGKGTNESGSYGVFIPAQIVSTLTLGKM